MADSDPELAGQIKRTLAEESSIADLDVDVEVREGVVYLRGEVDEEHQVAQATRVVRSVPGVVEVRNQLVVLPLRGPDVQPEVIWVRPRDEQEREEGR